jgi:uncharacterized protein (TIGR02996 family)
MNDEDAFQKAMLDSPDDLDLRLVFADWLEERGDPRAELIRLTHELTQKFDVPERREVESRLRKLVDDGVPAVGPFFTNSIGMEFAWVPSGTFLMGSPSTERGRFDDETQHPVRLSRGLYLSVYPVSVGQWLTIMEGKEEFGSNAQRPRTDVSWDKAISFCENLSALEERNYRIPTEAEWEYACRAGTTSAFVCGDEAERLGDYAWFLYSESSAIHPKKPNAWGLCEMHGSVWEWCVEHLYPESAMRPIAPLFRSDAAGHVVRGGSYINMSFFCRSANRRIHYADWSPHNVGLRVALSAFDADTPGPY